MYKFLKGKRKFLFSLILCFSGILSIFGCTTIKLYPRGNIGATESQNSVTVSRNRVSLTVLTNTWVEAPSDLPDYYTPLELVIRNDQEHDIEVNYSDFLLFDESGNQYRALVPADVERALGYSVGRYYAFFGFGYSRYQSSLFYDHFLSPYWSWGPFYPHYYSGSVQRMALLPGEIRPHAQVRGFLYFQRISPQSKEVSLEWRVGDATAITPTMIKVRFIVFRSKILRDGGS